MKRIIIGIIFIFLFFFGILGTIVGKEGSMYEYLLGGIALLLIPGTLLIYFGFRSRKKINKMTLTGSSNEYELNLKGPGNNEQSTNEQKEQSNIPPAIRESVPKIDDQQKKEIFIAIKLKVIFHKPIIKETISKSKVISSWEPETFGWVLAEDNGLTIYGSSKFSLLEKSLSGFPFFGPVFIKTLFSTIRDKKRFVPYKNIYRLVAATRPQHSSLWNGGDTECGIIHILFESSGRRSDVCAFSLNIGSQDTDLPAFWKFCSVKLGADKLDIRDEVIKKTLQIPISD
ncbi:MAG: hypothetical protein WCC06_12350 [Candidatus Aminicenantales bacterium]